MDPKMLSQGITTKRRIIKKKNVFLFFLKICKEIKDNQRNNPLKNAQKVQTFLSIYFLKYLD